MLKNVEDISSTKKRISFQIPADALEAEIKSSLTSVRARTRLPGFRPGKAPAALIEKRFGKEVESEVIEKLIPRFYSDALKEAGLRPVASPDFESGIDFKRNEPLDLTLLVEVRPKIEDLKYEGIKLTAIPTEVDDNDVDLALKRLQEDKAVYSPSEEAAADGDIVIVDIEVKDGGKSFKDQVFKVGDEMPTAPLTEKLKGMKKGEEREFEADLPVDFVMEGLAGVKGTVKASLREVKNVTLPALDDEFAKDLEFDDMGKLREHVRQRLADSKKKTVSMIMRAEAVKKLIEGHEFEVPEVMVEEELKYLVANAMARKAHGEEIEGSDEELRTTLAPSARKNVKASLLLQAIGEKEGVSVQEEDINKRVLEVAERSRLSPENVMKYYISKDGSLEGLKHSVFEDKVMDILVERAEMEEAKEKEK